MPSKSSIKRASSARFRCGLKRICGLTLKFCSDDFGGSQENSMRTVTLSVPILVFMLVFSFPALLEADGDNPSPDSVVIDSAQVDLLAKTIGISGRNFGDLMPVVNLGATALEVTSFKSNDREGKDCRKICALALTVCGFRRRRIPALWFSDVTVGDTGGKAR